MWKSSNQQDILHGIASTTEFQEVAEFEWQDLEHLKELLGSDGYIRRWIVISFDIHNGIQELISDNVNLLSHLSLHSSFVLSFLCTSKMHRLSTLAYLTWSIDCRVFSYNQFSYDYIVFYRQVLRLLVTFLIKRSNEEFSLIKPVYNGQIIFTRGSISAKLQERQQRCWCHYVDSQYSGCSIFCCEISFCLWKSTPTQVKYDEWVMMVDLVCLSSLWTTRWLWDLLMLISSSIRVSSQDALCVSQISPLRKHSVGLRSLAKLMDVSMGLEKHAISMMKPVSFA